MPPILLAFNTEAIPNPYQRHSRILYMARIAQGKSRGDLARQVGVCEETVRLWEVAKRPVDAVMLGRLALALDQPVELLTGIVEPDFELRAQLERQGLRQFWQLAVGERFTIPGEGEQVLEKIGSGAHEARRIGSKALHLVAVAPLTIVQTRIANGNQPRYHEFEPPFA